MNKNQKKILTSKLGTYKALIIALLFVPDVFAISLSALIAYILRFPGASLTAPDSPLVAQFDYKNILGLMVIGWVAVLVATGTYRFSHATLVVFNLRLLFKRSFFFFFFIGFLSFILKASFSRGVFLIMFSSGLVLLFLVRIMIHFLLIRPLTLSKKITSKMLIIGRDKKDLDEHTDWLIAHRALGFTITSRLICDEITLAWIEEFDRILQYNEITEVLLLPGMESDQNFSKLIHYCEDLNIHVNWVPLDSGNLGYWLVPSPQEGIPFLTFTKSEITLGMRFVKRSFDLVFSTLIMIVLSPIFLLITVAVLITSGRPIFYSSKRIGRNGRAFTFLKFRTMDKDADSRVHEIENVHGDKHVLFKNQVDPRITPLGRFLRRYSLDELPQFLNVLNNSMSVVGPRPALPREVHVYNSIYERRLIAKPGITGPWQISGRSDLDLRTSVALDLNYLINWSFTRDLWIVVSTVGAVFKGKGAY